MKKILIIGIVALLNTSCFNDNDDKLTFDFEGTWSLVDVKCFCDFGGVTDFTTHKITFNESDVVIQNLGTPEFLTNLEGEYTLDGNVLTFSNGDQYTYTVRLNRLELVFVDNPQIADDEVTYIYRRG